MVKVRTLAARSERWETAPCVRLQFAAPHLAPAVKNAKNSHGVGGLLYKKHQRERGGGAGEWMA